MNCTAVKWNRSFLLVLVCVLAYPMLSDITVSRAEVSEDAVMTELKIYMGPFMDFGPLFIAQEEGYFAEQGIALKTIRLSKSYDAIPALLGRDLDIAPAMVSAGTLNAIEKSNGAFKAVAAMSTLTGGSCPYAALLARTGLKNDAPLTRDNLRGKRFELPPAAVRAYFLDNWLNTFGLGIDDIQASYLSKPVVGESMARGAIDFTILSEPWLSRVVLAGQADIIASLGDSLGDFQFAVILFGPSILKDNPDLGVRFMIAYLKGIRQFLEGKSERNLEILAKHTGMDPAFLRTVCLPPVDAQGRIHFASVDSFQKWARRKGYIDALVDEGTFWDPLFVQQALELLQ